ncbi:HemK2/MTQ2 family protein methyltransferase [Gordonia humi]|uniref:Release factor glutamine methyltransferase n=1 Tax=Gordonia humi TaxID=686429 RepID=A0A840F257_9ACTN|nr:HemK2/MTQ2 family protein methyltransferase [Gordonia humi]MBB4136543.1 release factor glutamine methyltransferase [Gordonia humi]
MTVPVTGSTADIDSIPPVGVYAPREDTHLLIDELTKISLTGSRLLDLCTGSGAVAIAAALAGADVTAVDSCPAAVSHARRCALDAGVDIGVSCLDLADFGRTGFDVVTCNPPYVPTPSGTEDSLPGPAHAWNAGPDGRAVLDVLCTLLPGFLADGGTAFIVQSELSAVDATIAALRVGGLSARVVRERFVPYGPVVTSRRRQLVDAGCLDPNDDHEAIVVIRADKHHVR